MAVTVRETLEQSALRMADPVILAGGDSLDNDVRWATTSERYDVASFLPGGELLIAEGSALFAHLNPREQSAYVDSLADVGVAGLVVELVEGLRALPQPLLDRAQHRGLPIIGLRVRIPFVDACQSVNTLIVRSQLLLHMQMDGLSTILRRELGHVRDAQGIADRLSQIFGEHVSLHDAHGTLLAQAGPATAAGGIVIAVRNQHVPLATLEISQHVRLFDDHSRDQLAHSCSQILPMVIHQDMAASLTARVTAGPANGTHATDEEIRDTAHMLEALGMPDGAVLCPFAVGMRSLDGSMGLVLHAIGRLRTAGLRTIHQVDGGVLFGVCAAVDSGAGCGQVERCCADTLHDLADKDSGLWTCAGRASDDAGVLADSFGVIRAAAAGDTMAWGTTATIYDLLLRRFTQIGSTGEALAMLTQVMLGRALLADRTLLTTLAACFDAGDNRTKACATLSIGRQTLYNRLDKAHRHNAIGPDSGKAWSLLLFAASAALPGPC